MGWGLAAATNQVGQEQQLWFIQSPLTYAGYQKNCKCDEHCSRADKENINMQRPKVKSSEELNGYQPVTPF